MKTLIPERYMRLLDVAIRIILGAVFVYAGWVKVVDPLPLADSIASFKMLPRMLVNPLALGLPAFEIAAGLLLLVGWTRRVAALAIVTVTAVFAIAMLSALIRGINVDCGCFGAGGDSSLLTMWLHLARDLLLLAGAAISYRLGYKSWPGR